MNNKNIDLNLLIVFEALFETRSVSKAGELLDISQPSMSHALAKMRKAFDDPLFVRIKSEMQPTPHALRIADPIHKTLELARNEIFFQQSFSPSTSEKTFTLCMSDVGAACYLPAIIKLVRTTAPKVKINTVSPIVEKQTGGLESGAVDLAIGFFPDIINAGVFQQRLLHNTGFIYVANINNPYIDERSPAESLLSVPQISVKTEGRSHEVIEKTLNQLGLTRNIALSVSNYLSLITLVSQTDLIAIVPSDLEAILCSQQNIRILPLPFKTPTVEIKQVWHNRYHKDPAHQWIRDIVREALQN